MHNVEASVGENNFLFPEAPYMELSLQALPIEDFGLEDGECVHCFVLRLQSH